MGSIYGPKYKDRQGNIRQSSIWWVKYYAGGRAIRESSETADHAEAKRHLKAREGEAAKGKPVMKGQHTIRFQELAEDVLSDYQVNDAIP